jgi:hypothetical protein
MQPPHDENTRRVQEEVQQWQAQVEREPIPSLTTPAVHYWPDVPPRPGASVSKVARAVARAAVSRHSFLQLGPVPANSLPSAIGRLSSLTDLSITGTECTALPDSFCDLAGLQSLRLGVNGRLKRLPDGIGQLKQLRSLSVTETPLESLPKGIGALSNLVHLRLGGGTYKQMPASLGRLEALQKLEINSHPNLESLPAGLRGLEKLEELTIQWCPKLKSLPPLSGLRALKVLRLDQCPKLERLPADLGHLAYFENLSVVDVTNCVGLKDLPDSLCLLPDDCRILVPSRLQERLAELRNSEYVQPGCFW